jgi:hypothetical protein
MAENPERPVILSSIATLLNHASLVLTLYSQENWPEMRGLLDRIEEDAERIQQAMDRADLPFADGT